MNLTPYRIVSALALIGGIVLFIIGMNGSHAMADQVGTTFFSRFAHATTWYLLGGVVAGMIGLYLLLTDLLSRRTTPPGPLRHRRSRRSGTG
jgi:hypothetical protein